MGVGPRPRPHRGGNAARIRLAAGTQFPQTGQKGSSAASRVLSARSAYAFCWSSCPETKSFFGTVLESSFTEPLSQFDREQQTSWPLARPYPVPSSPRKTSASIPHTLPTPRARASSTSFCLQSSPSPRPQCCIFGEPELAAQAKKKDPPKKREWSEKPEDSQRRTRLQSRSALHRRPRDRGSWINLCTEKPGGSSSRASGASRCCASPSRTARSKGGEAQAPHQRGDGAALRLRQPLRQRRRAAGLRPVPLPRHEGTTSTTT